MRSVAILSAILATGASVVSAVTTCTEEIKVSEPTPTIDCEVVDANIVVDEALSGSLSLQGPKQLRKDLIIRNATKLIGISSSSINSVAGTLELTGLQLLSSFNMQSLTQVGNLKLQNLPQLSGMTLGSEGVTKAKSIVITDTFISDLSGLNIDQADTIDISNNGKLTMFNSVLSNVTTFKLTNNGNNMQVNMSNLEFAKEIQFRQVKSFDAPALNRVGSIKFNDSPELLSVSANNLTNIDASLTLINNKKLSELSFKSLVTIKGDLTVQNNTALEQIDGFPKVATVGAILLRGNFKNVSMPRLNDVQGSATASSTTDISTFCEFFDGLKKDGKIRGKESCTSNNKNANEGGSGGTSGNKQEDAAGVISVNTALLGLAAFAAFAQLL
ncbi:hypothetical protein HIM_04398 [Hirsutella minnesotensis 3608]|uniref:Protein ecm33 n=1 Tax=Hirsutella minnesotensis 3608 TaxID=1043627 RepID=A0A0F7ZLF0_9HYPO|nr:hypothetical protein HIM_04398 [Hirsutella minnesotensis 3608]